MCRRDWLMRTLDDQERSSGRLDTTHDLISGIGAASPVSRWLVVRQVQDAVAHGASLPSMPTVQHRLGNEQGEDRRKCGFRGELCEEVQTTTFETSGAR